MSIKKTLASLLVAGAVALGAGSKANAETILYDNFSSGTLDSSKWQETSGKYEGLPFSNQHQVKMRYNDYCYYVESGSHTGQETDLSLTRQFNSGDELDFSVSYLSGSGNGNYQGSLMNVYANDTLLGKIGYEVYGSQVHYGDLGWSLGNHSLTLDFFDDHISLNSYRDYDGVTVSKTITGINAPYTLTLNAFASQDSSSVFSMDNFYATPTPEPSTLSLLAIAGLGAGVYALRKQQGGIKNDNKK